MNIHDACLDAMHLATKSIVAADSAGKQEEAALWRHVLDHRIFIMRSGQDYRFEDYLQGLDPTRTSYVSESFNQSADDTSRQAMALLVHTLSVTADEEKRKLLLILIDMLNYIPENSQQAEFDDHRHAFYSSDDLWVTAFFDTREEAEGWLHQHAEPPSWAYVLIGDELYEAWYTRKDDRRKLFRSYSLEQLVADLVASGLPPATTALGTREEAQEWLKVHPPEPSRRLSIAGEDYLAIYHRKINHYSLHHIATTLKVWEEEKERRDRRRQQAPPR